MFLFSGGALRSSCGASGRASVRSLGFLEPPRGSAVWAVNGTVRLPCRGVGVVVKTGIMSGYLGIPQMELMSRSRGRFD